MNSNGGVRNAFTGSKGSGVSINIGRVNRNSRRKKNWANCRTIFVSRNWRKTERSGLTGTSVGGGKTKLGKILGH